MNNKFTAGLDVILVSLSRDALGPTLSPCILFDIRIKSCNLVLYTKSFRLHLIIKFGDLSNFNNYCSISVISNFVKTILCNFPLKGIKCRYCNMSSFSRTTTTYLTNLVQFASGVLYTRGQPYVLFF